MTEPAPRPHRVSPVLVAGVLLLVAVLAGAAVDRVAPATAPRARLPVAITSGGIWVCPIVSFGTEGGLVSMANASVDPSRIRVRIVRPPQSPLDRDLTLAAGRATSIIVPANRTGAGAIIQWSGGEVVASRSTRFTTTAKRHVAAGAACSRTGDRTLVVPGLRTLARDAHIVMLNPSSADAVVDVSFLVAGDEQTPETLTNRVVPGRGRLDVRVGDFVFDRDGIAAVVRVKTGTVVADGAVLGTQSAFIVPASAPRLEGVAAGAPGFGGHVSIATLAEEPATVVSTTMTSQGRETSANFPPVLDPLSSSGVVFPERGALSVALSGRRGSDFVATLGWTASDRGAGDIAQIPFTPPSRRWLAVAQSPLKSWSARLVLSNPGPETVHVRARLLTPRGQVASGDLADITILPGRVLAFPFISRDTVVGIDAIGIGGDIGFALIVGGGPRSDRHLFAVSGAPSRQERRSVVLDPQMGIPARLEP